MASHLVVIDTTARRHIIKTTPGKHLSDVLQEACAKFGLHADHYGLKHNNKPIDLSRTVRLSGLTSGAKLELVQASRSPSIVSIALQLPVSDATDDVTRLMDKFPSDTPIWQILRRFESGVAGESSTKPNYNFTQHATPHLSGEGGYGAGRLCYEMPVVNIMGRDIASFVDLQKTLGQLGFNGGTCLLRLSYQKTEQPLEEAMAAIEQYFKVAESPATPSVTHGTHGGAIGDLRSEPESTAAKMVQGVAGEDTLPADTSMADLLSDAEPSKDSSNPAQAAPEPDSTIPPASQTQSTAPNPTTASISIFSPPSSTTPLAATLTDHNESDYLPSIAHAQIHQARLNAESLNRRLLSDKELEAARQGRLVALSDVKDVTVRIRFPDQSQAQWTFGKETTSNNLYEMCRELMARPGGEEFVLRVAGVKTGTSVLPQASQRLIADLGWHGRVLVTVAWGDNVSADVRKAASLKDEYRAKAEDLKVDLPDVSHEEGDKSKGLEMEIQEEKAAEKGKGKSSGEKEARMMKLFGLGKKK